MTKHEKKERKKGIMFHPYNNPSISVRHSQAKTFLNLLGVHPREPAEHGASFNLRVLDDFLYCGIAGTTYR